MEFSRREIIIGPLVVSLQSLFPITVSGVTAGALTPTGFTVVADLDFPANTRLLVAADADTTFSNPVFTSSRAATTQTDKNGGNYHHGVRHVATGLTANTAYRYLLQVDNSRSSIVGTLKTAPTTGTPAAFKFMWGSCNNHAAGAVTNVETITDMASEGALFFAHLGDMGYDDYVGTDITVKRSTDAMKRNWSSIPAANALNLVCPLVYTPDDHDFSDDDGHWDKDYSATSTTFAEIAARTRQVYRETVPHYPFLQVERNEGTVADPCLAQVWDIANCRFIMPDCRSQARWATGTATCLGKTSGHEDWNQYAAIVAAAQEAATLGRGLIFLLSSRTWNGTSFASWRHRFNTERVALCNDLKAIENVPPIVILCGDGHQCAADDGTNTDASTGGGLKIVQFMSSPLFQNPLSSSGPYSWNGDTIGPDILDNDRAYGTVEVNAANTNCVVTFKGRSGAGALSTLGTFDTDDLAGW